MRPIKLPAICICIMLVCSLLVTACEVNIETPAATTTPPSVTFNGLKSVNIVECQFYGDCEENLNWKEIWPRLVEERFGVKINMTYPARIGYMSTIQTAADAGELTGIVELFGGPYVEWWKAQGLIYPLTEFLANNEVWNTIVPDYWKDAYTIENDIWAIPTGSDGVNVSYARCMRGDWLEKFNLEKPYTIDDFYEASYKFTYNDPDGDGINNTVGFTSSGLSNLHDIFQAYDSRLNTSAQNGLVWNPNTAVWEDSMMKPEMVECLSFLKKCFQDGLLDQECFNGLTSSEMRERVSSGLYGGTMYWDSWILSFEKNNKDLFPEAYMQYVGALSHKIDKNLNPYNPPPVGAPRVLMKGTPQPGETINWYVNTFLGDEWGFWTGRLGPVGDYRGQEDRACTIEDKTIIRNTYIDNTDSIKVYPGPGFIGGLPAKALYTVYEVAFHVPSPPEGLENWGQETAKRAATDIIRRKTWIDEYIENKMAFILPDNLRSPTSEMYYKYSEEINIATLETIQAAVIGKISIEDAISQYLDIAKTLGVNEMLDFENEKLMKTSD